MQIFTNVEFSERDRVAFASAVEPDLVYFGDPEDLSLADREVLLRSEVAFGSCPPDLLGPAADLRWLQLDSVGCDQYRQLDWAMLGGRLTVTNLRGFFAVPVAETSMAGVLALLRGLGGLAELRQQRAWRPVGLRSQLRTLSGSRALIAGYGAIGARPRRAPGRLWLCGRDLRQSVIRRPGSARSPDSMSGCRTRTSCSSPCPRLPARPDCSGQHDSGC